MENKAMEKAIERIYEQIALTGEVSEYQCILLMLYERKRKAPTYDIMKKYGKELINIVDKIFPNGGE